MNKFKIVGITQVHNELRKGHLTRFVRHIFSVVDELVVYDDGSSDGSYEYLLETRAHVLRGSDNNFYDELSHKKQLLEKAKTLNPDFILWMDTDEVLSVGSEFLLQQACQLCIDKGADAMMFPQINLWRSANWHRQDNGYNTGRFVRLWRCTPELSYGEVGTGLHQQQFPQSIIKMMLCNDIGVIHYGFASDKALAYKYLTYQAHGQKGWELERLLDEKTLSVEALPEALFPLGLYKNDEKPITRDFDTALAAIEQYRDEVFTPVVTFVACSQEPFPAANTVKPTTTLPHEIILSGAGVFPNVQREKNYTHFPVAYAEESTVSRLNRCLSAVTGDYTLISLIGTAPFATINITKCRTLLEPNTWLCITSNHGVIGFFLRSDSVSKLGGLPFGGSLDEVVQKMSHILMKQGRQKLEVSQESLV